jgi:hypothetical protein
MIAFGKTAFWRSEYNAPPSSLAGPPAINTPNSRIHAPAPASPAGRSLQIRELVFRNHPLNIVRFAPDAVSETAVCLDGHAADDGVDHRWIDFGTTLRPLRPVVNVVIQLVCM